MKRLLAVLGMLTALGGCANRAPYAPDPFFGRTAVLPPGTGAATPQPPGDPYYSSTGAAGVAPTTPPTLLSPPTSSTPASPSGSSAAPQWVPPSQTSPTGKPSGTTQPSPGVYGPPGGYNYQGTDTRTARPEQVTGFIQPRPGTTSADTRSSSVIPASGVTTASSARVIDIMDLPDKGTLTRTSAAQSGFRLVSATTDADAAPHAAARDNKSSRVAFTQLARYGYDRDYNWLKGKLEYSEVDRRWKLRYIPLDDDADQYGGSVVLAGRSLFDDFKPGDFVELRGRLVRGAASDWGYAPVYEVTAIKPL